MNAGSSAGTTWTRRRVKWSRKSQKQELILGFSAEIKDQRSLAYSVKKDCCNCCWLSPKMPVCACVIFLIPAVITVISCFHDETFAWSTTLLEFASCACKTSSSVRNKFIYTLFTSSVYDVWLICILMSFLYEHSIRSRCQEYTYLEIAFKTRICLELKSFAQSPGLVFVWL